MEASGGAQARPEVSKWNPGFEAWPLSLSCVISGRIFVPEPQTTGARGHPLAGLSWVPSSMWGLSFPVLFYLIEVDEGHANVTQLGGRRAGLAGALQRTRHSWTETGSGSWALHPSWRSGGSPG